jgi:hypothetical protein
MKNKKSIYILLPLVLIIWGLIIYRFLSFSTADITEDTASSNYSLKPIVLKPRDSFIIKVNYRDPFLGRMYSPPTKLTANLRKSRKKTTIAEPLQWPSVIYKGIVSDTKNKKKVFMVIINGTTYLMSEKDKEQEIQLNTGNRDFIEVTYKGNKNKINIQQ